jgi:ABC-2 type transport system permease protein
MARKEAIQLHRDPRSLVMAFLLPVLLLLFFGYAISYDINNIELAVLDESNSERSRGLVNAFESSGYFEIVEYPARYEDVDDLLQRSKVLAVLIIPPSFDRDLAAGPRPCRRT